ncbi:MAG: class I SAM-dependent methyltransferase [Gammaproteobacteria bacterium]|nr:class I SAM-dependent methyltransferase [Gammaproteobacteria bacterium]
MQRNGERTAGFGAFADGSADGSADELTDWFASEPGRDLLLRETDLLRERVRRFHGDCLLWLGPVPEATDATSRCMVKTRLFAAASMPGTRYENLVSLVARTESLPLASNSVDGVVLHHALEYAQDPRTAMREVTRVIRPGGRLLVCCFNPVSLWAVSRLRRRMGTVSAFRLNEWLAVLGFVREGSVHYLNYRAALNLKLTHPRWRQWSGWLNRTQAPLGGVYLTLATKESLARIPGSRVFSRTREQTPPLTVPGASHVAVAAGDGTAAHRRSRGP